MTEIHILSRVSWCNAPQNVESILSWFQKRFMENIIICRVFWKSAALPYNWCLCQNVPDIFLFKSMKVYWISIKKTENTGSNDLRSFDLVVSRKLIEGPELQSNQPRLTTPYQLKMLCCSISLHKQSGRRFLFSSSILELSEERIFKHLPTLFNSKCHNWCINFVSLKVLALAAHLNFAQSIFLKDATWLNLKFA